MSVHASGAGSGSTEPRRVGPDFICIGLPKAGTGWLFDQLDAHPDFWMPPVKELVYLNQRMPKLQFLTLSDEPVGKRPRERLLRRSPTSVMDREFMEAAKECQSKPMSLDRYATLFSMKGDRLSGDISPPYSNLDDEAVRSVAEMFPQVKIVLLVRDPVARAWSSISMSYRRGLFDPGLLEDPWGLASYLEGARQATYRATEVFHRWQRCASGVAFHHFIFDDIATHPESVLADIVGFIGGDPSRRGPLQPGHNRKATAAKLAENKGATAVMADHFKDELLECAAIFGGAAAAWPAKYGF